MSLKTKSYKPNQQRYQSIAYEITNPTKLERIKTELKWRFYKRLKTSGKTVIPGKRIFHLTEVNYAFKTEKT
jgi:hypothetical protein